MAGRGFVGRGIGWFACAITPCGCVYISDREHSGRLKDLPDPMDTDTEELALDLSIDLVDPDVLTPCYPEPLDVTASVDGAFASQAVTVLWGFDTLSGANQQSATTGPPFGGRSSFQLSLTPDRLPSAGTHGFELGVAAEGGYEESTSVDILVVEDAVPTLAGAVLVNNALAPLLWSSFAGNLASNAVNSLRAGNYSAIVVGINDPHVAAGWPEDDLEVSLVACPIGQDPVTDLAGCDTADADLSFTPLGVGGDLARAFSPQDFVDSGCDGTTDGWAFYVQVQGHPCEDTVYLPLGDPHLRFVHDDCDGDTYNTWDGDGDGVDCDKDVQPALCPGV